MYKCPECEKPISWWKGLGADPTNPCVCPGCGIDLHAPGDSLARLTFLGIVVSITGISSLIASIYFVSNDPRFGCCKAQPPSSELLKHFWPALLWFFAMTVCIVYDVSRTIRRGILVRTLPQHKARAVRHLLVAMVLVVIPIAYGMWRKWT